MDGVAITPVVFDGTFEAWRNLARDLLRREQPAEAVVWTEARAAQPALPGLTISRVNGSGNVTHPVPRAFLDKACIASFHRDEQRWALLYRLLWRLVHGGRGLLANDLDADVIRLNTMEHQVRRDEHKMHAFVRFRKVALEDGSAHYVAWHRPDHLIVRLAAPFFVERFKTMRWSILTPDESASWDGKSLTFGPGVPASEAPGEDALEVLWRTYYASMFNPARVNPRATVRELPVRHWPTLPEAELIPSLIAEASSRVQTMITTTSGGTSARPFVPEAAGIDELRQASRSCRGCGLFEHATQAVFGEGPVGARLMLVGEQPGDAEDLAGHPFVGPAGAVLDRAIADAGLDRGEVYVTNAVKHFTFRREGKRRIHERPRVSDVRACRPWLEAEIDRVRPVALVCLGSTAAQSLLGPSVRIQRDRGQEFPSKWAAHVLVTYHPSAVLRADDPAHGDDIYQSLVGDLRRAKELIASQLTS